MVVKPRCPECGTRRALGMTCPNAACPSRRAPVRPQPAKARAREELPGHPVTGALSTGLLR
jgi:hypothetical protein